MRRPTRGSVAAAVIYAGVLITLALCSAGALAVLLDCWPKVSIALTAGVVTWCGWECIREVSR